MIREQIGKWYGRKKIMQFEVIRCKWEHMDLYK